MAVLTDAPTRRRSPITFPEYRMGKAPPNKGRTFPAEPLTVGEAQALIRACARRGPSGIRNRALIVMLWRSGLRISEALALFPKDVELQECRGQVLHGKGDKRRTFGFDTQAATYLERWLDVRRELGIDGRAPLFCTIARDEWGPIGRPMRPAYVRQMLKRVARRAGVEKRVHPHGFRHTHAFELSMEGVALDVIRKQLGHSNLAVTARYVDHLAPEAVIKAMQARSWSDSDA